MLGQMRAGDGSQPPEQRFASQLDQLASMGFVDRQANIQGRFTYFKYRGDAAIFTTSRFTVSV